MGRMPKGPDSRIGDRQPPILHGTLHFKIDLREWSIPLSVFSGLQDYDREYQVKVRILCFDFMVAFDNVMSRGRPVTGRIGTALRRWWQNAVSTRY
jgi:hypothetical protein